MGMIDRYKKKGGFAQLLALMETSGKDKQDKFLKIIEDENVIWAKAIKQKMVSIQRFFQWDDNTVAEVVGTLNDLTVAVTYIGVDDKQKEKLFKLMDHSRKRKIDFILQEKKPNQSELNSAFMQVLTEVRRMINEGYIRLDKVDPELHWDSAFEEKLISGLLFDYDDAGQATKAEAAPASGEKVNTHELDTLRRKVSQLTQENDSLKQKLTQAEDKLDQIRKIA